ncbi:MAG: hypothetical protein A2Z14_04640 [Chloroflexi bacterium RBG_16_48_8]|nr:MAG: hypothetical protein A2Z14_04640 [Chloroflexi bacterium RBG_16_48_8]
MNLGNNILAISEGRTFAYTSLSNTVTIYNISDPTNPTVENHISNVGPMEALDVKEDYALTWIDGEGFKIYDWSVPQSPQIISELAFEGNAWSIVVENDIAFISRGDILEIDVSDPAHPQVIATINLPVRVRHLTISEGNGYAAAWDAGLLIFQILK